MGGNDSDDEIQFMGAGSSMSSAVNPRKESRKKKSPVRNQSSNSPSTSNPNQQQDHGGSRPTGIGLAGIDRAQMERERLRRQAERNSTLTATQISTSQNNHVNSSASTSTSATPSANFTNFTHFSQAVSTNASTSLSHSHHSKKQRTGINTMANLKSDSEESDEGPVSTVRSGIGSTRTSGTGPNGISFDACRRIGPAERFLEGAIKYSYNHHASEAAKGVPFQDLFLPATSRNPSGLKHALLATYCADLNWLFSIMPRDVPMTLVARNNGIDKIDTNQLPRNWQIHMPRKEELKTNTNYQKVQHIKLMLLSFETHLRICVLTGNLVDYDWERIENSALIFDAPRVSGGRKAAISDLGEQLLLTLKSLDLTSNHEMVNEIKSGAFDMSRAPFKLVLSAPTLVLTDWDSIEKLGLGRLMKIVNEFGLKNVSPGVLEAQGSSLGKYSQAWLKNFLAISSGAPPNRLPNLSTTAWDVDKVRLLFPSDRWVRQEAIEGPAGAGTFFGKLYTDPAINSLLRQPVSKRGNVMMHSKSLLFLRDQVTLQELAPNATSWSSSAGQTLGGSSSGVQKSQSQGGSKGKGKQVVDLISDDSETEDEDDFKPQTKKIQSSSTATATDSRDELVGFSYMGSHNFTQAAWGNLSGTAKNPKLSQSNWELGVIFPLRTSDLDPNNTTSLARAALNYRRDYRPYLGGDRPWIQSG